jgi:hypothetical protein
LPELTRADLIILKALAGLGELGRVPPLRHLRLSLSDLTELMARERGLTEDNTDRLSGS